MAIKPIAPCLWFDNQAEEAADFYLSVFPDGKINHVFHYGDDWQKKEGQVMLVDFEINGQRFTALNGGPEFTISEAISFEILCADQEEIDRYWAALTADGGSEGPCGWCKDKFGVSWQVASDRFYQLMGPENPKASQAAMDAMYTMQKLDIDELERVYQAASSPIAP